MTKTVFNCIRCFFLLILIFSLGMILVYLIPNEALEPQYSKSLAQIEKEDLYANLLFNSDASIMDNFMDTLMISTCRVSSEYGSLLQAAADNNGYPRYWNGYLLTLRPILTQFSYQQTRYINMFLLITAFCFCFSAIHREFSWIMALGFAVSVIMCFFVLISESFQYFTVFMILFAVLLVILYVPSFRKPEKAAVLLFAAGMVTNFFDMLTAPLLTLGMPLVILISFYCRDSGFLSSLLQTVLQSAAWGAGYALCWVSKWAIGTAVLGKNIFEDALTTARFRVEGSENYPLDRGLMFRQNFETYFFAKGHKPFLVIVLILAVLLFLLIRSHKKDWGRSFALMGLIALFPYIWYFVFANHSQLHYFYTYRIQAITLFAVFAAFENAISRRRAVQ